MIIEGVDFSWGRPGGAALVAAGKHFVVRYLTGTGKALTAGEIKDYTAHNIAIAVVFESTAGRALTAGFAGGAADAKASETALKALGLGTLPVYFAVDRDTTSANYANVDDYLNGAASVLGRERTGIYAEADLIDHCAKVKSASWFWQTYAWSGGRISPNAHLYQYRNGQIINGSKVDFTRALKLNYGQNEVSPVSPETPTPGDVVAINLQYALNVLKAGQPERAPAYIEKALAANAVKNAAAQPDCLEAVRAEYDRVVSKSTITPPARP